MAISLVMLPLVLTGCGKQPQQPADQRRGIGMLENPPPKPPDCPNTPELGNIRLPDGSLADVRIVQFDRTKLYFPAYWLGENFIDKRPRYSDQVGENWVKKFVPDIHASECPGVIHQYRTPEDGAGSTMPLISVHIGSGNFPPKNVSADFSGSLFIAQNSEPPAPKLRIMLGGLFYTAKIVPFDDVIAFINTQPGFGRKAIRSRSIQELFDWLATPPNRRDNDRKFFLKIDALADTE